MNREVIYVVTDQGPTTGIGIYAEALVNLLRERYPGLSLLSLCYLRGQELPGWRRLPGSEVAHHWFQVPLVLRHNYKLLRRVIPQDSAIHFCGSWYGSVLEYPRSIVTLHDYYPRSPALISLGEPRVLLRDASALKQFIQIPRQARTARARIVPTRYVQERLDRGCSLSSTAIHHWIDRSRFHPRNRLLSREALGLPLDRTLVLNVSAGTSNKNYTLLKTIAHHLGANYRMVKVGGSLPNNESLIHLPWIPHERYPLLFNACDVYLHTSTQEGFGRPLIESMASELPVVAHKSQVALEVLGDAGTYQGSNAPIREWIKSIELLSIDSVRTEVIRRIKLRLPLFDPARARDAYSQVYRKVFGK